MKKNVIFVLAWIIFLSCLTVKKFLSSFLGLVLADQLTCMISYICYGIIISVGSLATITLTFEVIDLITVFLQGPNPNMYDIDTHTLIAKRFPSDENTGLPHPVRMVNNPWATTGAVIVGVILVSKIIIRFFF